MGKKKITKSSSMGKETEEVEGRYRIFTEGHI